MNQQKKVLYLGVAFDGSGWSTAACDYALALDKAGLDVAMRSIRLNDNRDYSDVPQRVFELHQKHFTQPDVIIQNLLPSQMQYFPGMKNIGLYCTETTNFKGSSWPSHLNLMDEVWVFNEQSKQASLDSGVTVPIRVVPCPVDLSKYTRSYSKIKAIQECKDNGDFIFYTVGEFNRRKNYHALLKAFHLEFAPDEPVQLVIKTATKEGEVEHLAKEVKENLKIYPSAEHFKQEKVINGRLDSNGLMALHNTCDCFVSTSYGEALCLPARDALGMGKAVVAPDYAGFKTYLNDENSWLVPGRLEPVFGCLDSLSDLFTGKESWFSVDVLALQRAMREVYSNAELRRTKTGNAYRSLSQFSYNKVGSLMKEILAC